MKKATLTLMAACFVIAAQAKFLRVNNISGMAPYATIQAAVDAAQEGDTIMIDGSTEKYGGAKLDKRLVLIGPGYLLNKNGLSEVIADAVVDGWLEVEGEGTVLTGLHFNDRVEIKAPKVVITRCQFGGYNGLHFSSDADNGIIHQNYFSSPSVSFDQSYNHQVTNNIFYTMPINHPRNSYIAYNTCYGTGGCFESVGGEGNRVEKNIAHREGWEDNGENTYSDNYLVDFDFFSGTDTDKDVQERSFQLTNGAADNYGAFAGTDPYVISGLPAGPVIEALTVPVSVEEGTKLNVTIKLGVQR